MYITLLFPHPSQVIKSQEEVILLGVCVKGYQVFAHLPNLSSFVVYKVL